MADTEFEQFYAARIDSKKGAEQSVSIARATEINLDTVTAFLKRKFPDRHHTDGTSAFVRELKRAGFKTLIEVERDIDRAYQAFLEYEATPSNQHAIFRGHRGRETVTWPSIQQVLCADQKASKKERP